MTPRTTIQSNAMLVFYSCSQWTARKFDKQLTAEVNTNHGTDNAGRFHKILIAEEAIKKVQRAATAARKFHEQETTPYIYKGAALLASKNYFHYTHEMQKHQSAFLEAAQEVIDNYGALRAQAQIDLKGAFNSEDYPADVSSKYKISFRFAPVPQSGHLIVDIQAATLADLQADIDAQISEAAQANTDEVRERIEKVIKHAADTLKNPDKSFHKTLLSNIAELAEVIPRICITSSPEIDALADELKAYGTGYNADELRELPLIRKQAADDAAAILDTLTAIWG